MPPTICLSIQNAEIRKRHNSDKIHLFFFFFFFFSKVNHVVYSSSPINSPCFKALAQIVSRFGLIPWNPCSIEYSTEQQFILMRSLTLVLLNPDMSCLCKQCRSRSVGFWRSQLIWICTVCRYVNWIKLSDWLKIRIGGGILIYSAGQGLISFVQPYCSRQVSWSCFGYSLYWSVRLHHSSIWIQLQLFYWTHSIKSFPPGKMMCNTETL